MNSAKVQGDLWGQAPSDWAHFQEPKCNPLFEAMLDAANVGKATRFLDAGCGAATASLLAAERGAYVTGLDAAEGFIKFAQERLPSGDFRVGDIQELPFESDAFDAVIAASSVQYADSPVAALRELGRVCTPQGRIVAALWSSAEKVDFRVIFKAVRDALPQPPPGDGPFGLSAPGKLENLMEQAGLKILQSDEVNCPFVYPDFETFWRANAASGPMQGAKRAIGEEKLKQTLEEAAEAFRKDNGQIEIATNFFKYVVASP
jgi:SAM-dependent methyltransferase